MSSQIKSHKAVDQTATTDAQAVKPESLRSFCVRTGVRAASAQRQRCYKGYLTNGIVDGDAQCGTDAGCWRGTLNGAADKANLACINK